MTESDSSDPKESPLLQTSVHNTGDKKFNNDRNNVEISKDIEKSLVRKKMSTVWGDLKKRHLLWVKTVFFLQSAANVTLYPFLTLHMRSLGFSVKDASTVNTAIPIADVIGPPLAGLVADKLGNFRSVH